MSDDKQPIQPEKFVPVGHPESTGDSARKGFAARARQWLASPGFLIPLLLLIALALVLLPDNAPRQRAPQSQAEQQNEQLPQITTSPRPEESPWVDSQLLKARREAQEILASLLDVQERLESTDVQRWAVEAYAEIQALAVEGDQYYQNRAFEQALEQYRQALAKAEQLVETIPQQADDYLARGVDSLADNHIDRGLAQLQLARKLQPERQDIRQSLDRAQVRDQVLAQMEQAQKLAENPQTLEQARQALEQAKALDADYPPIDQQLTEVDARIRERDFRAAMSSGFQALEASQFDRAAEAFARAQELKPDAEAVDGALQQLESARLNTARQAALARAERAENDENWDQALTIYRQLREEDASLTAARLGAIRAGARADLDSRIRAILEDPLSLQADSKWQAANKTLSEARAIRSPGPLLREQVAKLEDILRKARTPVVVKLESDNMTEVEIYRVGQLGTFVEQALELYPGNYVIVGRRSGYRDVRIELAIDGSEPEVQLAVAASDPI